MNIKIKSVNKLEEQYRVIHPEYGTLVAVMGSEQLKDLLILITRKEEQAFAMHGAVILPERQGHIMSHFEGYSEDQVYLIKEQHYLTIRALAGFEYFEDGRELVSRQTYERAQMDDELVASWAMINGYECYFIKRKPEPFKWVKDRSPLDTMEEEDRVIIYNEAYHSKLFETTARRAKRKGMPWADVKHKDRFTADNPAPSPYDQ